MYKCVTHIYVHWDLNIKKWDEMVPAEMIPIFPANKYLTALSW